MLDEAQKVNKREKQCHNSIKGLFAESFLMMSGTLPHNRWHDISGYIDFLKGHPFDTHKKFIRTFGESQRPDISGLRLLQRFLQAFTIARPSSVLKLEQCQAWSAQFSFSDTEAALIQEAVGRYKQAQATTMSPEINGEDSHAGVLGLGIIAQLASLHPVLCEEATNHGELLLETMSDGDRAHDPFWGLTHGVMTDSEKERWAKRLSEDQNLSQPSRVAAFLKLFSWLQFTYPKEKIVAQVLRYHRQMPVYREGH